MEELDSLMQYAVSLEFNAPESPNQVAVIGIAFANAVYCREAYFLLKDHLQGNSIKAKISIKNIVLRLDILDQDDENLFSASLNYDKGFLSEFIKTWPPGQPISLIFGAKSACDFYVINPEPDNKDFQPFFVTNYEVAMNA
jgi:hypothetical protein